MAHMLCSFVANSAYREVVNLLDLPAGLVPVASVQQDDLDNVAGLGDQIPGVKEIKQVSCRLIMKQTKPCIGSNTSSVCGVDFLSLHCRLFMF